jgi:predicted ATP-dependent serine protease
VAKLLQLSPYGIFHRLDPILTLPECLCLYQRICRHCTPSYKLASSLLSTSASTSSTTTNVPPHEHHQRSEVSSNISTTQNYRYVSTGWDTLDRELKGGLRIGTITEFMGCAGTGKTQLALQTSIATALAATSGRRTVEAVVRYGLIRNKKLACCDCRK